MSKFLDSKGVKLQSEKIVIKDNKTNRKLQDLLTGVIKNQRHQRVIIIVDRTKENGCNKDDGEDMLLIYQLPKYNQIGKGYEQCEEHLSLMTANRLFPNWKYMDTAQCLDYNLYKGGVIDIGDRGFVFSFHIHDDKDIKCEQFIKSHKLPFLPHHIIDLWPLYFAKGCNDIDKDKFDKDKIYKDWKLATNDDRLVAWIESIDPDYYKNLKKDHLEYLSK